MSKDLQAKIEQPIAVVPDYTEFTGQGFEHQDRADIQIPMLNLLQPTSPQVEKMDNAKAGMLMNSVTEELFTELCFIPATTKHSYIEWIPRKNGGGFVADHSPLSSVVLAANSVAKEFNKLTHGDNELVETFTVFGVLYSGDDPIGPIVIPFSSTKIKVYKKWNTRLRTFMITLPDGRKVNPPMFAHRVKITTEKQENTKGVFYNFVMSPALEDMTKSLLQTNHPLFLAAQEVRRIVDSGAATAAHESTANDAEDGTPF